MSGGYIIGPWPFAEGAKFSNRTGDRLASHSDLVVAGRELLVANPGIRIIGIGPLAAEILHRPGYYRTRKGPHGLMKYQYQLWRLAHLQFTHFGGPSLSLAPRLPMFEKNKTATLTENIFIDFA